jgi:hypothetical protein
MVINGLDVTVVCENVYPKAIMIRYCLFMTVPEKILKALLHPHLSQKISQSKPTQWSLETLEGFQWNRGPYSGINLTSKFIMICQAWVLEHKFLAQTSDCSVQNVVFVERYSNLRHAR